MALYALRALGNPDDFEGDLTWIARRDIEDMVDDRRSADKVGPLLTWAERLLERHAALDAASPEDREVHFRKILSPGLIGNHAISHLRWVLDDRRSTWNRSRTGALSTDSDLVSEIIAAGRHGDINRWIRSTVPPVVLKRVRLPAERVVDEAHPSPGLLIPLGGSRSAVRDPCVSSPVPTTFTRSSRTRPGTSFRSFERSTRKRSIGQ